MAANTELVRIDNVEKELWDKIVESAESSSTGGVLVVNAVYDKTTEVATLDKTWKEIYDVDFVVIRAKFDDPNDGDSRDFVVSAFMEDGIYIVSTQTITFYTNSEDGYPTSVNPVTTPVTNPETNPVY